MAMVYPAGAERLGPEDGSPPAIAVYKGDKVVAYIFSTLGCLCADPLRRDRRRRA
jgi:transcriptional regulator of nitric oxide reductase